MNIASKAPKEVGTLSEKVVAEYLRRHGFSIRDHNIARKTGELDLVAEEGNILYFVEVKTILVDEFPEGKIREMTTIHRSIFMKRRYGRLRERENGMFLRISGKGSSRSTDVSCGYAVEIDWRASAICRKSSKAVRMLRAGRSMPVVRLLWEQVDRVQFSAAR